jgi:hypothetical protein
MATIVHGRVGAVRQVPDWLADLLGPCWERVPGDAVVVRESRLARIEAIQRSNGALSWIRM